MNYFQQKRNEKINKGIIFNGKEKINEGIILNGKRMKR